MIRFLDKLYCNLFPILLVFVLLSIIIGGIYFFGWHFASLAFSFMFGYVTAILFTMLMW